MESLQKLVAPDEWQARVTLAACYRLMDLYGMSDLSAAHISARVPGEVGYILVNPHGMFWDEITASSLLKIDEEGEVIGPTSTGSLGYAANKAGVILHTCIHNARHDVACAIHTHTVAGLAVSALDEGLLTIVQTAMRFAGIAYHDYQGVTFHRAEQASMASDLGSASAMILRNHGLVAVGNSIADAFMTMHRLELCCKVQLAAMRSGGTLRPIETAIVAHDYARYFESPDKPYGDLEWPALLRRVERLSPGFAA